MNRQALTVRDLLHCGDPSIDPMNIDTGEIKELSNAMPKDGNIDLNNAEILATKYLRGSDLCAELLAVAVAYVQTTDTLKKKEYSVAALERSEIYFADKNGGRKPDKITDKMRGLYADMDGDYIAVCQKHDEALAFAKWVDGKYNSFNKMHYMCKKILDRGYPHEMNANFNGTINGTSRMEEVEQNNDPTNEDVVENNDPAEEEWWK